MEAGDESVIHGINNTTRCLTPLGGDEGAEAHVWAVGTCSPATAANAVHLVHYVPENGTTGVETAYTVPDGAEVWRLASHPGHAHLLAAVVRDAGEPGATGRGLVYSMSDLPAFGAGDGDGDAALQLPSPTSPSALPQLEQTGSLPGGPGTELGPVVDVLISALDVTDSSAAVVCRRGVALATLDRDGLAAAVARYVLPSDGNGATCGARSPHASDEVAVAIGSRIVGYDVRAQSEAFVLEGAAAQGGAGIFSLDFNPNKLYCLASGHSDGSVAFWDVRKGGEPVVRMHEHAHWVWGLAYNHSYDQFVLSGSSDTLVKLYSVWSASSAWEASEAGRAGHPVDHVAKTYEEHDDSVYGLAWSRGDAWTFASVSGDGRVAIHAVPQEAKMQALMT
ncbi:TSSC1 protein [Thecamonas trahens ATCC 50062]|uniref:TSSC1 protein n=1 Tax=Thecamonas trahens ATCC 50062 TaxID=461836 RepID=A0A0L0D729_THETB|nr:TSSC1 protein [Thecamonas trahens ATCC 50062]KNC48015.1 TSSC1 protein [Thecamonas trahens ATCC 50062]|eukprot:XP_013759030.1 TSSC1 protein [Thecamonas trahens ATCC 50062]